MVLLCSLERFFRTDESLLTDEHIHKLSKEEISPEWFGQMEVCRVKWRAWSGELNSLDWAAVSCLNDQATTA